MDEGDTTGKTDGTRRALDVTTRVMTYLSMNTDRKINTINEIYIDVSAI